MIIILAFSPYLAVFAEGGRCGVKKFLFQVKGVHTGYCLNMFHTNLA